MLGKLLDEMPKPILILGDLNAHHAAWGSSTVNSAPESKKRGEAILDLAVYHDMVVLNNGTHTRIDPSTGLSQALDVSLCSVSHATSFTWKILLDYSGSDHLPILIDVPGNPKRSNLRPKWILKKANWELYENITNATLRSGCKYTVEEFTKKMIDAAEASIPKTTGNTGRKSVAWWNEEVKSAIKIRRKRLRTLRRLKENDPQKVTALKEFQEARSVCRRAINEAKQKSWENFVESINPATPTSQVWNNINRLQGKRQNSTITLNLPSGHSNDGQLVANALADEYQQKSSDAQYAESFRKKHKTNTCSMYKTQRANVHK
ncbi:uncharacterized protein LOC134210283 [Armigeres subalbatus]|uniref:uncharacterized protein LOC134210283 n=1 Tax=Armigeres subalbatus TaxID=124917 RepID=UPI002ED45F85